jgi:ATP-dependent Clp protease ATP-binding subunit ClpC
MRELMVHVERAVRAVHASPARKRRMRQELLAHLTNLVEEEKARGGDEQEALARALQRFGDPADLSRDLQASVPRLERWEAQMANGFLRRPGETGLRHGARIAALVAAIMFVWLNVLVNLLLPLIRVAAGEKWSDVRVGLAIPGVFAGYVFLSVLLCHGVIRELAGRPGAASLLRAAAYGVGAMLAGVALVAANYVAQPENPLWEFILRYPGNPLALSTGLCFACLPLALALAAVLVTRVGRAKARGQEDWASLEIGE